jgi:hypothetical protein
MLKQLTLASEADSAFATHHKTTRRDVFLAEMDKVVPWAVDPPLISSTDNLSFRVCFVG